MLKGSHFIAIAALAVIARQPAFAQVSTAAATPIQKAPAQSAAPHAPIEELPISDELAELNARIEQEYEARNFTTALPLAKQAVQIAEQTYALTDQRLITPLNNLGQLLCESGDLVLARPIFQRACKIAESQLGPDHPKTATCLNNLASTYNFQGEYQKARLLYERALAILEKKYGKESGEIVPTLINLAGILEHEGELGRALTYQQRSLAIAEKDPSVEKSDYATSLQAVALSKTQRLEVSIPMLQKALELLESELGPNDTDVAVALNNLAMAYRDQANQGNKDFSQSLRLLERATAIYESNFGPDHIRVYVLQNSLGDIYAAAGNMAAAQRHFLRAARICDVYSREVLPTMPQSEQQAFILTHLQTETSLLLSTCKSGPELKEAYDLILRWKGLLIESMRRESVLQRLDRTPATHALVEQLKALRSQLAGWYQTAGSIEYKDWKAQNDKLSFEKEKIEEELVRVAKSKEMDDCLEGIGVREVGARLAADEALVDCYRYGYFNKGFRYAAIVLTPTNPDQPVFIDLGSDEDVKEAVNDWREDVHQHTEATGTWAHLKRQTWDPIVPKLGTAVKKIWLCPDADLARMPWHLFPLVGENMTKLLAEVDSVRELVALTIDKTAPAETNSLFIAGGLDFDANPAGNLVKPKDGISAPKLPGTIKEMQIIAALARQEKFSVTELTNASATRKAVMAALPKASYVHMATHGFFFDEQFLKTVFGSELDSRGVGLISKGETPKSTPVAIATAPQIASTAPSSSVQITPKLRGITRRHRNPLVESGLLLSSSNMRDPANGLSPGILTAEELVGIDLRGCKMMTLSACETGLGSTIAGQGVMGLRASLLAAGAKCVLISLWKVPDAPTVKIMDEYYKNLWVKHLSPAESLNRAQATLRQSARSTPPILWAAWVLVGKSW
jgi:CHAT domain-containing protein